jgi:hypothetical protein
MAFPFVVSEVVRPLRIDAQHATTLSFKLQRRAPRSLSPAAKKELVHLKQCTERLNDAISNDVSKEPSPTDPRPLARALITAWSTLHTRLESLTRLDAETVPENAQATALLAAAFAEGTAFLRGDYETLWLRGQHSLDAIAEGGHTETLERLVGDFVLRAVRAAHHKLGVATGLVGSVRPVADDTAAPDRRALLEEVTASMARYAHLITAIDDDDAAAVAEVVHALEPMLKHRAKVRSSRDETADDEDPIEEPDAQKPAQPVVQPDAPPSNDADAVKRRVA